MKKHCCFAWAIILATGVASAQYTPLKSPDGKLEFDFSVKDSTMTYRVSYQGRSVILPSPLGISGWEQGAVTGIQATSSDTRWKPVYGERAEVRDHYNQIAYTLRKRNNRSDSLCLLVRAYDAGIAFRYMYEGNNNVRIASEQTAFAVPEGTYAWFAPYAQALHRRLPVENWPGEAERPLTLELGNGLYASLLEAGVVDYCRTKFVVNGGEKNVIRCRMYDAVEDIAPFSTPWRVIMVGEQPKDLLANNDLILNLNAPCQIGDTEWIQPGTVIRTTSLSTAGAEEVIDFAARRHIRYVHFDAGWYGPEASKASDPARADMRPQLNLDMPEVVKYARSKGVGIWVYVNQRALSTHLDEILPLYESWGVAGIKFGFVHVGSSRWTAWLHEAVRKCAKHHLMVDIHDEYRPTGYSRTYPNLLTQEGVRGNEEFPDGANNTTLPFTRFLAGAADCTICYYHRRELKPALQKNPKARALLNTSCHQMALSVINYSPLQFLYWYDKPEDVQDEPELPFFDHLPTTWDDTKVLEGKIGGYVSIARRKDDVWYVGSITNNDGRKFELPLSFLQAGRKYELTLYTDGGDRVKTRTHVAIARKEVTGKSVLKLDLMPRGGCAMVIREKEFNADAAIAYCLQQVDSALVHLKAPVAMPQHILYGATSKAWACSNIYGWTSGFWPGILWYAYQAKKDETLRSQAEKYSQALYPILDRPVTHHDLGFMLYSSLGNGYRLTQNPEYKKMLLRTADSLAVLYNPKVGTINSWPDMCRKKGWPHLTIIDNMLNLEVLFWAAKNGGDKHLYDIAERHAEVTMKNQFRNDYSTCHVVVYDTITGNRIRQVTHQGYADTSMWARGQAWAIYGFTMCYRYTGNKAFLETARKAAAIYLKRLPADKIPYWDFDDPDIPYAPRDASAAAVVASALLELSHYVDKKSGVYYHSEAVAMLRSLSSSRYQSRQKNDAFLLHSTGHKPNNSEVDASIIYADYYYLEALLRLKND